MRALAGAFDGAGNALFRPARSRAHLPPKNLLIVRLDHLGDVWNITGLPKAVKEHFSDCRVTCLVSSAAAPLLESNPFVDEIIRFDAPWFWKKRQVPSQGQLVRELKKRRFDTALSIRGDVREHWILFQAGITRRIGAGITGGGFLLTDPVTWRDDSHELERIAAVAEPIGLPPNIWKPEIHFASDERERLLGEAEAAGVRRNGTLVGYLVEAGSPAKTWPTDHSVRFLEALLHKRPDVRIALLGSGSARAEEIFRRIGATHAQRLLNLCGRMPLRQLAAAGERFALLVAPDSGPAHMLAWLGVPTVFLYSGTNRFESWKPMAERTSVLRNHVPCSPCGLRTCAVPGHPCMEGIEPENVLESVLECLG